MDKIIEAVFYFSLEELKEWLEKITQYPVTIDDEVVVVHKTGCVIGFPFKCDPITKAVMIASAITSPSTWMIAFPSLLASVEKEWKNFNRHQSRKKNKRISENNFL